MPSTLSLSLGLTVRCLCLCLCLSLSLSLSFPRSLARSRSGSHAPPRGRRRAVAGLAGALSPQNPPPLSPDASGEEEGRKRGGGVCVEGAGVRTRHVAPHSAPLLSPR
eukprot:2718244-Rhodomonas_salina.1